MSSSLLDHWGITLPRKDDNCSDLEDWGWRLCDVAARYRCPVRSLRYFLIRRNVAVRYAPSGRAYFGKQDVSGAFSRAPDVYRDELGLVRWGEAIRTLKCTRAMADRTARACGITLRYYYAPIRNGWYKIMAFIHPEEVGMIREELRLKKRFQERQLFFSLFD